YARPPPSRQNTWLLALTRSHQPRTRHSGLCRPGRRSIARQSISVLDPPELRFALRSRREPTGLDRSAAGSQGACQLHANEPCGRLRGRFVLARRVEGLEETPKLRSLDREQGRDSVAPTAGIEGNGHVRLTQTEGSGDLGRAGRLVKPGEEHLDGPSRPASHRRTDRASRRGLRRAPDRTLERGSPDVRERAP